MIALGLGANLNSIYGSPEQAIKKCPELFQQHNIKVAKLSSIWKSAPVPESDQPWYHNAVCLVETSLEPKALLERLAQIEQEAGRVREVRNEPRVLDLDILVYHDEIVEDNKLILPHPRMHERAFVLYPLQELAPNWHHPKLNKSLQAIIAGLPSQQIERIENA